MICEDCEEREATYHGNDPFMEEVYDIKKECHLCDYCLKLHYQDI